MKPTLICLATVAALCSASLTHAAEADLSARIESLEAQLRQLQAHQQAQTEASGSTVFSGYGEINYTRPTSRSADTQFDLSRLVLGLQHRFDARTKLVTELEIEHTVSSAKDSGEVAVEQAYIERQLTDTWIARAGLFLIPLGLLNENHEPNVRRGVERNRVETAIIPTTWREGGVRFTGNFDSGLTWDSGVSTGFDLSKWDSTASEGIETPLGSVHQELALARARDLSVFSVVNWRGVPGLQLGGGVFTGGATQGQTPTRARVTLWEAHARWTPGDWDLSALYAAGAISGTAALNQTLLGGTQIPKRFDGKNVQVAYTAWRSGEMKVTPFARIDWVNTGRDYANVGTGVTPQARHTDRQLTLGVDWHLTPGVVLKADWQRLSSANSDVTTGNQVNLGLGWSF